VIHGNALAIIEFGAVGLYTDRLLAVIGQCPGACASKRGTQAEQ